MPVLRRLLALFCLGLALSATARESVVGSVITGLPAEARETLRLIDAGGPFPYRRDGIVFQNREQRLPAQARGYYREYTVPTPGRADRGARRIIAGGNPPVEFYYTGDHYRSFQKVQR